MELHINSGAAFSELGVVKDHQESIMQEKWLKDMLPLRQGYSRIMMTHECSYFSFSTAHLQTSLQSQWTVAGETKCGCQRSRDDILWWWRLRHWYFIPTSETTWHRNRNILVRVKGNVSHLTLRRRQAVRLYDLSSILHDSQHPTCINLHKQHIYEHQNAKKWNHRALLQKCTVFVAWNKGKPDFNLLLGSI